MLTKVKNPLATAEVKFSKNDDYEFEGYASVFGGVDSEFDTILPGAFTDVVETFKSTGKAPIGFFNHAHFEVPVVKWLDMEQDGVGLKVKGRLTKGIQKAEELRLAMKDDNVDGISIGFERSSAEYEEKNGRGRVYKSIKSMPEISVVTFPADGSARIKLDSVKSALDSIQSISEFEQFLREVAGCSKSAATAVASIALKLSQREADESQQAILNTLNQFNIGR